MENESTAATAIRCGLGALLALGAVSCIGGGWYGLSGAEGVPTEWLQGSPFTDYTIPSFILVVVVGGSFALGSVAVLGRWPSGPLFAAGAGLTVLGWIAAQVSIIGFVSWLQPTTALVGVVVIMLAGRLFPG